MECNVVLKRVQTARLEIVGLCLLLDKLLVCLKGLNIGKCGKPSGLPHCPKETSGDPQVQSPS
jgi:hypothetical protein